MTEFVTVPRPVTLGTDGLFAVQALAALRSLDGADVCASPSTQGGVI